MGFQNSYSSDKITIFCTTTAEKNTVFLTNNCFNYTVVRDTDKLNRNFAVLHVEVFVRDKQL
jgi:hypothetical protein